MAWQARARSLYRSLYREVKLQSHPVVTVNNADVPYNSQFLTHLRATFDKNLPNPESELKKGDDFLHFLQGQREYKALLERYNPSIGMDPDEKIRLTGRRVGFDLPTEYKEDK
ncbi:hypothetical protein YB2330_001598 [Saitoella coloradoensis]